MFGEMQCLGSNERGAKKCKALSPGKEPFQGGKKNLSSPMLAQRGATPNVPQVSGLSGS